MRSLPSLALTATVGVAGLVLAPAAAAASPDDSVAYLASQLDAGGNRLVVTSGGQSYDDLGLTIDAVLGMSATGTAGDASAAATDYIVANAGTYYGSGDEIYSAATGKLLTFASARGLDPHSVGGVDLVAQQQSLEADNGQFVDQSQYGDYSNTLGQSFGIIGLERAGTNPTPASVDFLLAQQCDDGGFSLEFKDGCVSDPDATSTAVQALDLVGGHDAQVQSAADYLEGRQDGSGGIGGGATTEGSNANSTGLAATALRIAGRDGARTQALAYLEALTFGCDTPALVGAVAYNQADFDAAVAKGAEAAPDGTITRSTTQALLGRTGQSYATVTSAGQSAATPTTDCAAPAPGGDTAPDAGSDTTTGTDSGDSGDAVTDQPVAQPEIPAIVQTDGVASHTPIWALGAGSGLLVLGLTLVVRRRAAVRVR